MRPGLVKVAHLTFEIVYLSDKKWLKNEALDDKACGTTLCPQTTIYIRVYKDQNEDVTREILLHELLHVIFYVSCLATSKVGKDWEEMVIRTVSPNLFTMLKENPELADYLNDA